jgi:hypothetical protein
MLIVSYVLSTSTIIFFLIFPDPALVHLTVATKF